MPTKLNKLIVAIFLLFIFGPSIFAQIQEAGINKNQAEREKWLQDAGFGMFIHFSFDSQLGIVISHSMVGASEDYLKRFTEELPQTFDPYRFNPKALANLAKLAGMKYIVLTTKHHSGFCLWDTKTTDFNIMNTAYGKDLVKEYVEALRVAGLGVGFYFSPEDFYYLYKNGQTIRRRFPKPLPAAFMAEYIDFTQKQLTELMTNYGKIDMLFFDGGEGDLLEKSKDLCWDIQSDVLITRGAIKTPEQTVPGVASEGVWEACITMGNQWQYKHGHNEYKSASRMIDILIESRAKGGSLLLNVGPGPSGALPETQEDRLREIAAWSFINREAIEGVRPWVVTNEGNIWFVQKPEEKTVYAFLTRIPNWPRGERKSFLLRSVKASSRTKVAVVGQNDKVLEYNASVVPDTRFKQTDQGLEVSCVRAHRIYNNHKWHNPLVLKITHAEAAFDPPLVKTQKPKTSSQQILLLGQLLDSGDGQALSFAFEYRPYAFTENLESENWEITPWQTIGKDKDFQQEIKELSPGTYEFRALIKHPKIIMRGEHVQLVVE